MGNERTATMITRAIAILGTALLLAGCAIGNKYDLSAGTAPLAETTTSIAIAISDQRAYVLNGDKTPNFVGLQRGGYGNPFDVTTRSGAPLADDLTKLLVNSYTQAGARASALQVPRGATERDALPAFNATEADRLLLIEMREWKTDVFAQVTVSFDVTARVFDRSGTELASQSIRGTEGTGTSGVFEERKNEIANSEVRRRFGELLSRPDITAALN